jgi:flagellar biosynthesis protein FliR
VYGVPELQRAWLPLEIYPVSAGMKGGLAGSVAMAVLAMLYGVVSGTSIWYPINLLAVGLFPNAARLTTSEIAAFHLRALLIAIPIHLITSLLVGLLYGAMLPVLARRPILLGGFLAPLFWSALLYNVLGIVNPVLNRRIDWFWFVPSQIAFGIVAGFIVSRQERVRTWQGVPLAARIGVEAPGMIAPNDDEEDS